MCGVDICKSDKRESLSDPLITISSLVCVAADLFLSINEQIDKSMYVIILITESESYYMFVLHSFSSAFHIHPCHNIQIQLPLFSAIPVVRGLDEPSLCNLPGAGCLGVRSPLLTDFESPSATGPVLPVLSYFSPL